MSAAKSMTSRTQSGRAKCASWSLSQCLIVTLWDTCSESYLRFPLTQRIHSWTSVTELKECVERELGYPPESQRLYLRNQELCNDAEMKDLVPRSCSILAEKTQLDIILSTRNLSHSASYEDYSMQSVTNSSIAVFGTLPVDNLLKDQLRAIRAGFEQGLEPCLTEEGTSGSYLLKQAKEDETSISVAVWKPIDEEPFAPHNPRGMQAPFGSNTCRPGVKSGESSLREVLAYQLDHDHFAGVPTTALVELSHPSLQMSPLCEDQVVSKEFFNLISGLLPLNNQSNLPKLPSMAPNTTINTHVSSPSVSTSSSENILPHPKIGSFQTFVPSIGPIEDYSSSLFTADEVHKIAVLDLRIFNLDRNEGNILVQRVTNPAPGEPELRLIPIDHGLTIPDSLAIQSFDLAWLSYAQAEEAFSQKTLDYISKLDVDADINLLENNFKIRPECLRNIKISSLLLKKAAAKGLNLAQIGQFICRPDDDEEAPSLLEKIVDKAQLYTNTRLQIQSKFKNALVQLILEKDAAPGDLSDQSKSKYDKKPAPLKRMAKNNSFDEKDVSVKTAILASMGAEQNDDDDSSPGIRRGRGMTEGIDEHQIHQINANTHGMIQQNVHQLQNRRQSRQKRCELLSAIQSFGSISDYELEALATPLPMLAASSVSSSAAANAKQVVKKIPHSHMMMRRATSYVQPHTFMGNANAEDQLSCPEVANSVRSATQNNRNGKHRRAIQAKQAWIKHQFNETSSNAESLKIQRARQNAERLAVRGGPHDAEFFNCFNQYLDEALNQFGQAGAASQQS